MDGLRHMQDLINQISEHLNEPTKGNRRAAIKKLNDVATISSTLALTLRVAR